jgi:hypothetical protein
MCDEKQNKELSLQYFNYSERKKQEHWEFDISSSFTVQEMLLGPWIQGGGD